MKALKTISKYGFITIVMNYFALTELSRKHVEEIYNANGFYKCKNQRDVRIQSYITRHVGEYEVIQEE